MHDENFQEVQQLVALKRHEQPNDAYFEEFLDEFHRRQRQDLLQRSSRSLFFERVGTWFSMGSKMRFVYAGGAAYAAVILGFFFWPKQDVTTKPALDTVPIHYVSEQKEDMLQPDKNKEPIHEAY